MSKRTLNKLVEQINGLIEVAEKIAEEEELSFTINFGNGEDFTRDWENSWSSSMSC